MELALFVNWSHNGVIFQKTPIPNFKVRRNFILHSQLPYEYRKYREDPRGILRISLDNSSCERIRRREP
jgi:hypothetical protein